MTFFNEIKKVVDFGGQELSIETGKIARQANGSVVVTCGKNKVLAAVTISPNSGSGNFLPLTVHFIEKSYAVGQIPSGFFKRETKPSEASVLVSRLIDRTIRPLFPKNFFNEINVVCTLLSYDGQSAIDMIALTACSAALAISGAPIDKSIAGAKVGLFDGNFKANPTNSELDNSDLDLTVAGSKDSIFMVESEAKEISEEKMLEALDFAHNSFKPIIDVIDELKAEVGKEKIEHYAEDSKGIYEELEKEFGDKIAQSYCIKEKKARYSALNEIRNKIIEDFLVKNNKKIEEKFSGKVSDVAGLIEFSEEVKKFKEGKILDIIHQVEKSIVRKNIIKSKERIDGRKLDEVRHIEIELGILPAAHGSALFTRGETQAIVSSTLSTSPKDRQTLDNIISPATEESFMLHYNFPPYSVGEVGQLRAPGRREIGHGKLAWKAINPIHPSIEEFGYATRVVSEITESNGSSSMATVCGSSLALMDAGVPLKKAVSGIAMGLIKEGENYAVLSDIMGDEDHLGDMDFKVAGTSDGITSLQMDIKIDGVNSAIMKDALNQAKEGRSHILGKMNEVISESRAELSSNLPKTRTINIPVRRIKDVIGAKGKTIKSICEKAVVQIDIDNKGLVKISGESDANIDEAIKIIDDISFEPEVGKIYEGPVVNIIDAGAFITIHENKDGFVHISELSEFRVDYVEDVINEGDIVKVKVIGIDKKGRPKLSYRSVDQITGKDIGSDDNSNDDKKPEERKRRFF
jgi:polyribonucleotide nucleotidyltransferase